MPSFESLLREHRGAVERLVRYRVPCPSDADDILQETYLSAYQSFDTLRDTAQFKPWLFRIARNKCTDHFRRQAAGNLLPLDALIKAGAAPSRLGPVRIPAVSETLDLLPPAEKQILRLYYWEELSQAQIAAGLGIPLGTVKSRLHTARKSFKANYPYHPHPKKGEISMKKLPEYLPEFVITPSEQPPFPVRWEELMGWFLVPKAGEKLSWAMYDMPGRKRTELCKMEVTGKASVHGIEGVEVRSLEYDIPFEKDQLSDDPAQRRFIAQLTDTHCRYLAEEQEENGVKVFRTFLDGDAFLNNWGFGENNCGNEVNLRPKGDITRRGDVITSADKVFLLDVVGRYTVTIAGKSYDTVCVVDIETYNEGVVSEQFLDANGRTILWRRFNADDWCVDKYGAPWSRLLPHNPRLIVNGKVYVNWYNCITDYIL